MLLYHIATKIKPQIASQLALLTKYVVEGKIDSELRLNGINHFDMCYKAICQLVLYSCHGLFVSQSSWRCKHQSL